MPSQLDEVCKKYGYKGINVATWRDPSLSVLAGGRGPRTGYRVARADVGKPFIPTYKVKYPVPEPTDDESSGDEMRNKINDSYDEREDEALVDSPLQSAHEDPIDDKPDETILEATEQPWKDDVDDEIPDAWNIDEDESSPKQNDVEVLVEAEPAADDASPPEHNEPAPDMPNAVEDAAPEAPVETKPEATRKADKSTGDLPPVGEGHPEEKKVAFAPDTPDPKPTQRKKKGGKAAKGKKKRAAAPAWEDPPADQAFGDDTAGTTPPPDPPAPLEHENEVEPVQAQEEADAAITEAASGNDGLAVDDVRATEAAEASEPPAEESLKEGAESDGAVDTAVEQPKDDSDADAASDVANLPPPEDSAAIGADSVEPPTNDESRADPAPNIEDLPPPPPSPPTEDEWPEDFSKKKAKKSSKKKGSKALPELEPGTTVIDEQLAATPRDSSIEETAELPSQSAQPVPKEEELVPQEADPVDDLWAPATSKKKKKGKKSNKVAESPPIEQAPTPEEPGDAIVDFTAADDVQPEPEPELATAEPPLPPPSASSEAETEDSSSKKKKGKKASKKKEAKAKALEAFASAGGLGTDAPEESSTPPVEEPVVESKEDVILESAGGEETVVDGGQEAEADQATAAPGDLPVDDATDAVREESEAAVDAVGDNAEGEAGSLTDSGVAVEKEEKDDVAGATTDKRPEDDVKGSDDAIDREVAEYDSPTVDEDNAEDTVAADILKDVAESEANQELLVKEDEKDEDIGVLQDQTATGGEASSEIAAPADGDETVEEVANHTVDTALPEGGEEDRESLTAKDVNEAQGSDGPGQTTASPETGAAAEEPAAEAVPAEDVSADDLAPARASEPLSAETAASDDHFVEAAREEDIAPDECPPDPPSPALTKTTSRGSHKSTHWDRPHQTNRLKEAFEGPVALKRPHGHRTGSQDEVIHRGERKHRSRCDSVTMDKEKERKGRKMAEKKRDEAAARVVEEGRRKAEDEVAQRKRHEARRRERAAAKEEEARLARKESERDAERRRKRRHEREMREIDRREEELREELREKGKAAKAREMEDERSSRTGGGARSARPPRSSMSSTSSARPILAKMFTGESVHRTGFLVSYGPGGGGDEEDRPVSRRSKDSAVGSSRGSPRMERTKTAPGAVIAGLEALDESPSSSRDSRRREGGEGEHRRRRPTMDKEKEKPKSFLGSLFKRSS